jgi:hypothetical protein
MIARYRATSASWLPSEVQYIDVAPSQMVGVSAGLIPFLEHDDANRALMGSNMQRQAVPLLVTEPPIVATGMETGRGPQLEHGGPRRRAGKVTYVDATGSRSATDIYDLRKFVGLNERTCLNQKPIVKPGRQGREGEVIADGAATFRANWPWDATCWSASCRSTATTSRTRSSSARSWSRRHLHLDSHRGVRRRDPRDEAGPRGVHARHPQRQREGAPQSGRGGDRPRRHLRPPRATSWWARSRPRARPN